MWVNQEKFENAVKAGNFVIFYATLIFMITVNSVLSTFLLVTIINPDSKYVLTVPKNVTFYPESG